MSVNWSSEIMLTMYFCRSGFSGMVSFTFWSLWFFFVVVFVLWVTNIIYQNLMLLVFAYQKTPFLCKHNFFVDEKQTQWNLDTKAKDFMKIFHVSWNAAETAFHEMLWEKTLAVYISSYIDFYNSTHYTFFIFINKARSRPFKHVIQHVIQHVKNKMLELFAHRITHV